MNIEAITTYLLVYTNYHPKEHDLERLEKQVINCNARFNVFPKTTKEEQDLKYLSGKEEALKGLTEEVCKTKIMEISQF